MSLLRSLITFRFGYYKHSAPLGLNRCHRCLIQWPFALSACHPSLAEPFLSHFSTGSLCRKISAGNVPVRNRMPKFIFDYFLVTLQMSNPLCYLRTQNENNIGIVPAKILECR